MSLSWIDFQAMIIWWHFGFWLSLASIKWSGFQEPSQLPIGTKKCWHLHAHQRGSCYSQLTSSFFSWFSCQLVWRRGTWHTDLTYTSPQWAALLQHGQIFLPLHWGLNASGLHVKKCKLKISQTPRWSLTVQSWGVRHHPHHFSKVKRTLRTNPTARWKPWLA